MIAKSGKFGPRLTVSITGDDYDALSSLAEKDEVSISWVVRRAIEKYLASHRGDMVVARLKNKPPQEAENATTQLQRNLQAGGNGAR